MSSLRSGTPGATRVCPHCKATVLETATICPGCRHHLRFSADATPGADDEGYCALSVDGSIAHKVTTEPCEYFVVFEIRDERGEQLARQVVGVGVLQPGELRRLNVSVGMRPVRALAAAKSQTPLSTSSRQSAAQPGAAAVRPPPQPPLAVDSRLQPRSTGKPTGPGTTGGSSPRFRNFHKP
ncbi:MAG: hypothetical protein ACLQFF_04025 [Steroidobacteraceae bacterium]|jgi:hypothetical protein